MEATAHVDADRLRRDLMENAQFGAIEAADGHGRTVLTGSAADKQARNHLIEILDGLGCTVRIDSVGNIAGRWVPPGVDPETAPLAIGSHLDSVPNGGIFDGPLGVYAGVETVRAFQEADQTPARPIEVVSFTEEEGSTFGRGLLGSAVATGAYDETEALSLTDEDGQTLREQLSAMGMHGDEKIDPETWHGWLEVHIEQGTVLERAQSPIGIVSAITGVSTGRIEITGRADHAGATGMDERADALTAASEFVRTLERRTEAVRATDSEFATVTIGEFEVAPGTSNVVPEQVHASLDIRDTNQQVIDRLYEAARSIGARIERTRDVAFTIERTQTVAPTALSDRYQQVLHAAGSSIGVDPISLPSGGGHDTMQVAACTDAGLVFVRSEDGRSHSPQEYSPWADCATAVETVVGAVPELSTG